MAELARPAIAVDLFNPELRREHQMRKIIPDRLWLGNAADARDLEGVLEAGIVAMVDLAMEELTPVLPRSTVYCRFPVVDGEPGNRQVLSMAIETVVSLLEKRIPTLVFCRAGMSRSPSVVAAALAIVNGGSPEQRLAEVVAGKPHDVSPLFWAAVCEVYEAIRR